MRRYNIKIDGEVMPNDYSYEELVINDILEFDDDDNIYIKLVSDYNWSTIKGYVFPEEQESYIIDEFGRVVSQNNIGGGGTTPTASIRPSTLSTSLTSSSRPSMPSTSPNNTSPLTHNNDTVIAIIAIIMFIIIFIVLPCIFG